MVHGIIDRIMRRPHPHDDTDPATKRTLLPWRRDLDLQGTPAGAVSRVAAFAFDWFLLGVIFVFLQRMYAFGLEVLTGHTWIPSEHRVAAGIAFIVWVFLYFAVPLAVLGRTPGKGLLGTKVQMLDGRPLGARRAGLRTLVLPLSFLLFGLGLCARTVPARSAHLARSDRRHGRGLRVGRPGRPPPAAGHAPGVRRGHAHRSVLRYLRPVSARTTATV